MMNDSRENPGDWTRLVAVAELPPGSQRFIAVGTRELAVFHQADPSRFVVMDNSCPHAGGNLSAGEIDHGAVVCPWHEWAFSLDTGRCTESERVCVRMYECRVENGHVFARLSG